MNGGPVWKKKNNQQNLYEGKNWLEKRRNLGPSSSFRKGGGVGGGGREMTGESCCFCVAVLVLALWASLVRLVSCSVLLGAVCISLILCLVCCRWSI